MRRETAEAPEASPQVNLMRRWRRQTRAVFLLLLGSAVLAVGGMRVAPKLSVITGWNTAEATMQRIQVLSSHDGEGYGIFRVSGTYAAQVNGSTTLTCTDDDWTRDFARAAARANQLRGQLTRRIHFSGRACDLAAADTLSYLGTPLLFVFIGLLLIAGGAYLWVRSRRKVERCSNCGSALRPYYRHCPECAASIQRNPHPIAV